MAALGRKMEVSRHEDGEENEDQQGRWNNTRQGKTAAWVWLAAHHIGQGAVAKPTHAGVGAAESLAAVVGDEARYAPEKE